MREIAAISADLTKLSDEIKSKMKAHEAAQHNLSKAASELTSAQSKASALRTEMEQALDLLVPGSLQGRVRQTP